MVPVRKPLPSGLNGTNPDAELLQGGDDLLLEAAVPERVLALQGGDGLDGVERAGSFAASGQAGCHLAVDQLPNRAGHVLDRHLRVHAVLVEQVDHVHAKPPQRVLHGARMSSGRLETPRCCRGGSRSKPNVVAITT